MSALQIQGPDVPLSDGSAPMVLHVRVMAGTGGGPEKTILRSPKYMDPGRYRMAIAYIHPEGDPGIEKIRSQAIEQGAPLFTIPERSALSPASYRACRQLVDDLDAAIWHGHDYKSDLFGYLIRRGRDELKCMATVHNWTDESLRLRLYRKIDEWCLSRYDLCAAVSDKVEADCLRVGVPRERLVRLVNGIELDDWARDRTPPDARMELGLPADRLTIGVVGRLSAAKALHRLLRLTRGLLEAGAPPLQVLLLGDGPERDALELQADELELGDVVRFVGWQTELQKWYETFDLVVMTSIREGLPNTLLEAMAMEVASASTPVGGVRDLYDEGRCGVILDGDDPDQWVACVMDLLQDPIRRAELARLGRERIETEFSFAGRMKKMVELYDRLWGATLELKR